jgi:N-acetylglucosaminyldiphosphoundecaprenol N-acetyl-beta-D-mannosaminyltransferase
VADELAQFTHRVSFLKVPVDIVDPDQLDLVAFYLSRRGEADNIVLLSLWDLLRARRKGEYRDYVQKATLVIPISKSIIKGIQFLQGKQAIRYMPFDFVIRILVMLEKHELSNYLLGGKKPILAKAEKNIRETFPGLLVVGRYPGSFKRHEEAVIIEAIRKASPSLLLVGKGVRGGECWLARHSKQLGVGMRMWCSDLFDVFAKRRQHPSDAVFNLGLEWVGYYLRSPFKLLRIFPFIYYHFLLVSYKFAKKDY